MTDAKDAAAELAGRLIEARADRAPLPRSEADALEARLDLAAAYRVQEAVCERFGPAVAWKTGRKNSGDPVIAAPVLAGGLRPSGAVFTSRELNGCGIELEIAFRVDRILPPVDAPDFESAARGCVTPVAAIEVIDGRFEDFLTLPPLVKLADNQINGGLVHAEPEAGDGGVDFARPDMWLTFNGVTIASGRQPVPGGDAFENFLAFARMLGGHCGGLKPGQIVTTGSLNGLPLVSRGTKIEGFIAGLGHISTAFE